VAFRTSILYRFRPRLKNIRESACRSVHPCEIPEFLRRGFASPKKLPTGTVFWVGSLLSAYSSNGTISGDRNHFGVPFVRDFDGGCAVWAIGADKRFGAYWSQKVQLWWQQLLLIFLRTNVIFCTKTNMILYGGSNSSQGGAP